MRYQLPPNIRNVSDEEVLEDMRRVARGCRDSHLTYEGYRRRGKYGNKTVLRRFGTWNNGLVKAGLEVKRHYRIPELELFVQLDMMWRKFGRPPRRSDWERVETRFSHACYVRRFGTWRGALEGFVEWANRRSKGRRGGLIGARAKLGDGRPTARGAPYRLRYEVLRRDQFRCVQCGRSPANETGVILHLDHIEPWSKGGETVFENLQTLCERCNLGKATLAARE